MPRTSHAAPHASAAAASSAASAARRSAAGVLIGAGLLGGFLDGIALHQIAQWHNMGSAVLPPTTLEAMHRNMTWDGWFHAAMWVLTLAGVWRLHGDARAGRALPSARGFLGQLVLGAGLFNLVEGVIDHHLLGIHHVRDMPVHVPLYDWLFLAVAGVGFTALGAWLAREPVGARPDARPDGRR